MLVYKAAQVVAAQPYEEKGWEMPDDQNPGKMRSGISRFCDVTVISTNGSVASVRMKGKTADEVKAKVAKLTIGKPAEIVITAMKTGARGVLVLEA
jgi:hypothetical protein